MKTIHKNTRIKRKTDVISSQIDGEAVMMSLKNGEYYGLNETGSYIWDELVNESSVNKLVAQLTQQYEVDENTCLDEVTRLVYDLQKKDLIEVVEE
ncbi:MAG: lasso peptide biosynthesis PqqD family chaperone [Bacteroidetes bacterium]|jgi:hypothetical protein|nr:lasso peptide biosynthesis PqqD family chaperone [Bacteroidota bacterium]